MEKTKGLIESVPPSFKISRIKELSKCNFLVVGDTLPDVSILQNENKMNAELGKNVKTSLPKPSKPATTRQKSLAVEGVPTYITDDDEFKEFIDLNKINYDKAERLKSKKDGRVLQMFRLEVNDPTEAEARISET